MGFGRHLQSPITSACVHTFNRTVKCPAPKVTSRPLQVHCMPVFLKYLLLIANVLCNVYSLSTLSTYMGPVCYVSDNFVRGRVFVKVKILLMDLFFFLRS